MFTKQILPFVFCLLFSMHLMGQPPTAPAGFKWVLVDEVSDEFNGNSLDATKWYDYIPGWPGRAPSLFQPESISVGDGYMQLQLGLLDEPMGDYTIRTGAIKSISQMAGYGYYESRFKSSNVSMSTSFWMVSDFTPIPGGCSEDKYRTELDVVETIGDPQTYPEFGDHMLSNTHYRHVGCEGGYNDTFYSEGTNSPLSSGVAEEFHTYGAYWHNTNEVTFYADGVQGNTVYMNTEISPTPFDHTMSVIVSSATYDFEQVPSDEALMDDTRNTAYCDWIRVYELVPAPAQVAYPNGIPHPIPGTIELEDYDIGGEGISYHDQDPTNRGYTNYRTDEWVDIESRDGSYTLGYTGGQEWLEYTTDATAGTYDIALRVATISSATSIELKLDNEILTTVNLPNTGGWGTFETVTIPNITITGGNDKVLRLTYIGGGANANWVSFSPAGQSPYFTGVPQEIPGMVELENYDNGGEGIAYHDNDPTNNGSGNYRADEGVDIEAQDGGYAVGYGNDGEWLEYTVNATEGIYDVEIRMASNAPSTKGLSVSLDGELLGTIALPNTGGWANFQTLLALSNIAVDGGNNKILRLEFLNGGGNINWINFIPKQNIAELGVGNLANTNATPDGWFSNMVINETESYTANTRQTVCINTFNFYAWQQADPVTPFVVKVNGDNDFTVLKIGTTRTAAEYNIGANTFDFKNGGASITLQQGETIAMGFLDANPDGTGGVTGSVIPYATSSTVEDEIWYTGGAYGNAAGSVVEGIAPIPGTVFITTLIREYRFNIGISVYDYGCVDHRYITSPELPSDQYLARETITSDAVLESGTGILFDASNHVLLEAGFFVPVSTVLEVKVADGCQ